MWKHSLILLVLLTTVSAYGESFNHRVRDANQMLVKGNLDGALSTYRDLQTDDPESPLLYYGEGCAQYKQGEKELSAPSPEHAIKAFKSAESSFDKATLSPDKKLRTQAGYNRANCTAQLAMLSTKTGDQKAITEAFKDAITQYEDFIRQHPDHEAAKNNLDHMRYLLKKMLQNPPKQQKNKNNKNGQNKKDQNQKNSDNKNQNKNKQNEANQKQQQRNQGQQGQSQKKEAKKKEQQPGKEAQSGNKPQQDKDKQGSQTKQSQPEQKMANAGKMEEQEGKKNTEEEQKGKKYDRQTINAILDSLEAQDNREQKELRDNPGEIRVRRDWW